MATRKYCYRLGDGNEGNYPRFLITLQENECPYAAIAALVANRYIVGSKTRRHIVANVQTDGEPEYGISGTVYEGPKGEQAFGAAWITAELEPVADSDYPSLQEYGLREFLDLAAWRQYLRLTRQ